MLVLLAFAVRALTLTAQSLWLDEVDALAFAARPVLDLIAMMAQPAQNGPLYYLALKAWTFLAGESEFGLRAFSLLAGLPAIPLIARVGRQLGSAPAGLGAALLAAVSPYLFWYGQEGKMYALYLTLALASMTLFLDGLARGGRARWAGWLAVTAAGVHVHLFFVYLVLAQHGMALALLTQGDRPRGLRAWYVLQAAALALLLPLAAWGLPALAGGYPTAFEPQPLAAMLEVLFLRFSFNREACPPPAVLAPFALALAAAAWTALRPRPARPQERCGARLLWVWLLLPVLVSAAVALRVPAFMHRYFTLIAPAYLLLLAWGVMELAGRRPTRPAGLVCGAALAGTLALALAYPAEVRPDFRAAASYVGAAAAPGDRALFVAGYGERAFRYYLPESRLPGVAAPYANDSLPAPAAALALEQAVGATERVWLVEFEEWLWDSRGLAENWLKDHGRIVDAAIFPGVRVTAFAVEAGSLPPAQQNRGWGGEGP